MVNEDDSSYEGDRLDELIYGDRISIDDDK